MLRTPVGRVEHERTGLAAYYMGARLRSGTRAKLSDTSLDQGSRSCPIPARGIAGRCNRRLSESASDDAAACVRGPRRENVLTVTKTPMRAATNLDAGWTALRGGRWVAARTCFEDALAEQETPETLEGLSWAAWWLDDADAVFGARERAYRLYSDAGTRRRRADGDVAGADELDFHGAVAVASGWLAARAACSTRSSRVPSTAGWHSTRATSRTRAATATAPRSSRVERRRARAPVRGPRPGDARPRLEGATLVACAQRRGGHALPRRGDRGGARGRGRDPDLERVDVLLLRHRVHVGARLRARVRVVRSDRGVRGALRQPLHARLLPRGVRRGAPLARPLAEAEELLEAAVEDFARSRPAYAAGPPSSSAELRRRQGRTDEALRCSRQAGASPARSCAARGSRSTQANRAAPSSWSSGCFARCRAPRSGSCAGPGAARARVDRARRARRARRPSRSCASSSELIGTAPLRACADLAEGMLAAARGRSRARAHAARGCR